MTLISIMVRLMAVINTLSSLSLVRGSAAGPTGTQTSQSLCLQTEFPGVPGCYNDTTPVQGASRYRDGEGVYIGSDCNATSALEGVPCWTDYFLVGTTSEYKHFYQPSGLGDINCPSNGTCFQQIQNTEQTCTTFQWGLSETLTTNFELNFGDLKWSIGASFGSTQSWSNQWCGSNTTTQGCTWTDGGCHSVWAAQRIDTLYGYIRRSCSAQQAPYGNYTIGMLDYALPLPGVSDINCNLTCDQLNPVTDDFGPLPNNGSFTAWPGTPVENNATNTFITTPFPYLVAVTTQTTTQFATAQPATVTWAAETQTITAGTQDGGYTWTDVQQAGTTTEPGGGVWSFIFTSVSYATTTEACPT